MKSGVKTSIALAPLRVACLCVIFDLVACGIVKDKYNVSYKHRKNGTPAEDPGAEIIPTEPTEGGVKGRVRGAGGRLQTVNGMAGSSLSDVSVFFPPGSLAIDTDVLIQSGTDLDGDAELTDRGLNGSVTARSASTQVATSAPMDAVSPFVLALPLPGNGTQLAQGTGSVLVLYDVTRVSDGTRQRGFFKQDQLKLSDRDVRFTSRYFGTYQAVYFEPARAKPPAIAKKIYFQPGMAVLTFGGSRPRVNHYAGWGSFVTPFRLEAGGFLSTGIITRAILP